MGIIQRNQSAPVSAASAPPSPAPAQQSVPAVVATVSAPIPQPAPVVQQAPPPPAPAPTTTLPAVAAPTSLARATVPDYLMQYVAPEGQIAPGLENAGDVGLGMPMLMLAQPLTPEVMQGKLKVGDVYTSVNKEQAIFGKGHAPEFIPVFHFREWIKWRHRELGGGIVARSKDPKGELARCALRDLQNRKPGGPPSAAEQPETTFEYHVFLLFFRGADANGHPALEGPYALPMSKTKHRKGKLLLQLIQALGARVPIFGGAYSMAPIMESRGPNTWANLDIKSAGFASASEVAQCAEAYKAAREAFEQMQLAYDDDAAATPDDVPAGGAPTKAPDKGF